jgi:ABC-type oligopeptide transport system substrate-binding subunit
MQARAVILALAATIVVSAPAWAENVLRWSTPAEHQTFDPHAVTGYIPIQSIIQVYEGLIRPTAGTLISWSPGLRSPGDWLNRPPGSSSCGLA